MRIGYARVSTYDQNIEMQMRALRAAGCVKIHSDQGLSGASRSRPGLVRSLSELSAGDTLVIWRLDRLGRSLSHLIEVVDELGRKEIGLYSITESIDTASAGGILIFHIMGALAEFERALIIERTRAGVAAARKRGQVLGRRRKLNDAQIVHARAAIAAGSESVASMARLLGVERSTLWRALNR